MDHQIPFNPLEDPETLLLDFIHFVRSSSLEECNSHGIMVTAAMDHLVKEYYFTDSEKYNLVLEAISHAAQQPTISVIHVCFLKELLRQKQYAVAASTLRWDTISKYLPTNLLLEYCLLAAYHCLGNNELYEAQGWLFSIVYLPVTALTVFHERALFSFLLLHLGLNGKRYPINSTTCGNLLPLKTFMAPYESYIDAYQKGIHPLRAVLKENWLRFETDNAIPFILFSLEQFPKHQIHKLRRNFRSLPISYVADMLSLSEEKAWEIVRKYDDKSKLIQSEDGQYFVEFDPLEPITFIQCKELSDKLSESAKILESVKEMKSMYFSKSPYKKSTTQTKA
ncbi:COP9/signalosome complex subunit Csn3 [Schizosaccharomyces cryophilus OY26]|uniref:COP9/signalosome complex subunit Csn3 n=1 Tax=Schizosaccharomyces cryophilus (strain OY26 / ATCC MYA-4695 / CBS 11777 / NBRC 106824 / NRRL Y48691) TaxID=653667 RepID=S9X125_SCHCR|nr:COP9/signalosome complex subunit Csn3 [Schizosaccharomyces cryophilus OY26]EPY50767.1 COP9/signalosome complex subunit Csn3 [Schizosaccharomyces cryophilus OY26]